jgi:hypothetical protein
MLNRGNELKDSLKTQALAKNVHSKRTQFSQEKMDINAKKSSISGARRGETRGLAQTSCSGRSAASP